MSKVIKKTRKEKLKRIKEAGINPYPSESGRTHTTEEAVLNFDNLSNNSEEVVLVGRIRSIRSHGNSTFCHIEDATGSFQVYFKKDELGEDSYMFFINNFDVGDFIETKGSLFITKKGEKTLLVNEYKILSKSLLPLPEKWHGIKETESRLRKRYLDILFNKEIKEMIEKKSVFWQAARDYHKKAGFLEVETPILEAATGGADARPFKTHYNSLDMDVYLRISAGELWQKRLMVAGFEKTFEIGRIFRNEGVSPEHLQDYTQCEAYWAYADYEDMYKFLRDCLKHAAKEAFGKLDFKIRGMDVDLGKDWPLLDYTEEIEKQTKINIWESSEEDLKKKTKELGVTPEVENRSRLIDAIWKHCRKNIPGPAILINLPKSMSPLAKSSSDNKKIVQRFQFIIAGSEVTNGYSELNNPIEQKKRFKKQQEMRDAGDEEAQMYDKDFIEALEYGMPPTAGHGFSERFFAFLMDKPTRECQVFPLMRPKDKQ